MMEFDNYREPEYRINAGKGIIIGRTEIMIDLFRYLNHLADLPTTVLLRGETGTGKELCAKALHHNGNGQRKGKNFVAVNCAGIPSELLESELFGYVKGAFTGAYRDTPGKFQHADGGTILLDEIGDMTPKLQAKVLRVLQERQVTRVGSNKAEDIEVRVIAATNRDLEEEVKKGSFREDLYYRLNVVPVRVPALSERKEDIPLIAEYFIKKYNEIYGAHLEGLSISAKEKLKLVEWKGNVRELENVVERVFVLVREGVIRADDLYFNSEMPRRILLRQTSGREPQVQSPQEEKAQRLWYEEGVLPISPKSLSEMDGSKSYVDIRIISYERKVYAVIFGSGNQQSRLIYLTPQNANLFFDTNTEDYKKLEDIIRNGEFNKIAHAPFAFLSMSDLIANLHTFKTESTIKRAAERAKAYRVPLGSSSCFAITEANAVYFTSTGLGRGQRVAQLQNTVRESYEQFRNWKPS